MNSFPLANTTKCFSSHAKQSHSLMPWVSKIWLRGCRTTGEHQKLGNLLCCRIRDLWPCWAWPSVASMACCPWTHSPRLVTSTSAAITTATTTMPWTGSSLQGALWSWSGLEPQLNFLHWVFYTEKDWFWSLFHCYVFIYSTDGVTLQGLMTVISYHTQKTSILFSSINYFTWTFVLLVTRCNFSIH